jgi:hypothetical protein
MSTLRLSVTEYTEQVIDLECKGVTMEEAVLVSKAVLDLMIAKSLEQQKKT